MSRVRFSYDVVDGGILLRLLEDKTFRSASPIAIEQWANRTSDLGLSATARILARLDDIESPVKAMAGGVFVDHNFIAELTEPQALSLG
jgi:hypothetical protein